MKRMMIGLLVFSACTATGVFARTEPHRAYEGATNRESIEAYMDLFSDDMVMIDVTRTFTTPESIRSWALREVTPQGRTFKHLRTLAEGPGYVKTRVKWLSWEALYYYWTDEAGKIRKMSLQYGRVGETGARDVYHKLPPAVQLYFDGIRSGVDAMLEEAFTPSPGLRVVGRTFEGRSGILRFARSEVYGGRYELIDLISADEDEVLIHLRFQPRGWSSFEPDAVYRFTLKDGLIDRMDLQYK